MAPKPQQMNLPKLFTERITSKLGIEAPAFFEALKDKPEVSIRLNPKKGLHLFPEAEQVPWCEYGRYLAVRPSFVFDPLYHAGAYYAQEASSMLFANAIDFSKDIKVLDLCAAPGGKSSLILSQLSPDSLLVSNELVGKRNSILCENLIKWGYPNLIITKNRAEDFLEFQGFFDVVLVDAPCSGEGMFRKDEEAIMQWNEGLVQQCSRIQENILDSAIKLVAPGGLLIYSTCTFEEAENENNISRLYEDYAHKIEPVSIPIKPEWGLKEVSIPLNENEIQPAYYCFPHLVKGEGLFVAAIRVTDNKTSNYSRPSKNLLSKPATKELAFVKPYIDEVDGIGIYTYEDKIVLFPQSLEREVNALLFRINIRQVGVTAGVLLRDVFLPDHSLALSGMVNRSIPYIELELQQALEYMKREPGTPQARLPKGWFLYTYQNLPIGWAKNIGNRINNHYPSEWRIRKALS
jgi:16S rRNA C967 or C1407 C5-methylase (RsmB/RsmF family)/NOL1/NOP2/fmu family ribosome biogenesis protein